MFHNTVTHTCARSHALKIDLNWSFHDRLPNFANTVKIARLHPTFIDMAQTEPAQTGA
jgi:hypothetical protein